MLLTNLGAELVNNNTIQRKAEGMELHKKKKTAKILKALERGSLLAQRLVTWYSSILEIVRESGSIINLLAYWTTYLTYLTLLFYSPCFILLFPFAWDKIDLNSLPSFLGRKNSKTIPKCVFAKFQMHLIKKNSKTITNCVFAKFQMQLIENILRQFQIVS